MVRIKCCQKLKRQHYLTIMWAVIFLAVVGTAAFFIYKSCSKHYEISTNTVFDSDTNLEAFIETMPLLDKVGQMFVLDVPGTELSEYDQSMLTQNSVGNFILMGRNLQSLQQIKKLNKQLTVYSKKAFRGIPPLISIDQECGSIIRMYKGCAVFPGAMTIAATQSLEECESISTLIASELAYVGINLNYAPDSDVNSDPLNPIIGDRSFGDDPQKVSKFVQAYIRGHHASGVLACSKHFPGHGATHQDSHQELPRIEHNLEQMKAIDVPPFQAAMEADVDLIMVGHLLTPLDEDNPCSISEKAYTYLRKDLGFKGLAITDSMVMKALDQSKFALKCLTAILAGADLICACDGDAAVVDKYDTIQYIANEATNNKELMDRIDESVLRILRYKQKNFEKWEENLNQSDAIDFNQNKHHSQEIHDKSITLYKNEESILPVSPNNHSYKQIYVIESNFSTSPSTNDYMNEKLYDQIKDIDSHTEVHQLLFHSDPADEEIEQIMEKVNQSDDTTLFIFAPYKSKSHSIQKDLINTINNKTKHFVLASYSDPYEFMNYPDIKTIVIAYEVSPYAIISVGKAIIGKIECNGTLPFTIN